MWLYGNNILFLFLVRERKKTPINLLFRLFVHSLVDSRICLTGIKPAILASQDNVLTNGQGYKVLNVIIELLPWGT